MGAASKAFTEDEFMTVQSAMGALSESRVRVLSLIARGILAQQVIANRVFVRRDSVAAELQRRKQRAANEEIAAAK